MNDFNYFQCGKCWWYGKQIDCPAEYNPDKPPGQRCNNFIEKDGEKVCTQQYR